ncbi:MAG: DUF5693 family protein [Candidatus Promineifilaceae bacterium]
MKPSQLLSLSLAAAGGVGALGVLARRARWEAANRRVAICLDYDDAQSAAIRAGLPFDDLLARAKAHGATHLGLPELTLNRLVDLGRLTPIAPAVPLWAEPPLGHWNYLHGPTGLLSHLETELQYRLRQLQPCLVAETTLAFAGDRPTVGEIGLGFERDLAARAGRQGLGVVPRPVSYAWPERALLERSLAQAADLGRYLAFAGDMILGHEMHLDEVVAALAAHDLVPVYFAESRHQKGDWFVAKRRAPNVILGHCFTPEEMIPLDFHAAAHQWAYLARERGVRFCYVNFFRVLHATEPLEGLHYLAHLKEALEAAGFEVSAEVELPRPIPGPSAAELGLAGLTPAGAAGAAFSAGLRLPDSVALPLTLAGAAAALGAPRLEQRLLAGGRRREHDHSNAERAPAGHAHEHAAGEGDHQHDHSETAGSAADLSALYPPSYVPKLLALATAAFGPAAAAAGDPDSAGERALLAAAYPLASAVALAAMTSGGDYQLRIEEYRGYGLDWFLPLALAAGRLPTAGLRAGFLAALTAGWLLARWRGLDALALLERGHAIGHTHHVSAAQRLMGDIMRALGPRPARKWAGFGPPALQAAYFLRRAGRPRQAALVEMAGVAASCLGLAGCRRPERSLRATLAGTFPGFAAGSTAAGLTALLAGRDANA